MKYAANTNVSCEKSRAEIEKTLSRYGADSFMYGWDSDRAVIGFRMHDRHIKFILPMPLKEDFRKTETGRRRGDQVMLVEWEKGCRQRWRALSLVIKAKLEAVESGISEFEEEFLANIVLPNGKTYGEFAVPQLQDIYSQGKMPSLLPGLSKRN